MKADVCSKTRNGSTGTIAPKANRPKDDAAADLGDPPGSDGSMPSSSRASMSTASPGLAVSRPARRRAARSSNPLAGKNDGQILPLDVREIGRALCRERVCQDVLIWGAAVPLKNTKYI